MRRLLSLCSLLLLALPAWAHRVSAQIPPVRESYELGGEVALNNADVARVMSPSLLNRASALVAMAQEAPAAAATPAVARLAAHFAQLATSAYDVAAASYEAGFYQSADSAARQAISMAEFATADAMRQPEDVLVVSAGAVSTAGPSVLLVPNPAPAVLITQSGERLPPSYADLSPQPFGAILAGPYAPPMPDSLPFGATPVGRKPALIAP